MNECVHELPIIYDVVIALWTISCSGGEPSAPVEQIQTVEDIGLGICTMHSDKKLQRLCKRNTNDGKPCAVLFVSYHFLPQCILKRGWLNNSILYWCKSLSGWVCREMHIFKFLNIKLTYHCSYILNSYFLNSIFLIDFLNSKYFRKGRKVHDSEPNRCCMVKFWNDKILSCSN